MSGPGLTRFETLLAEGAPSSRQNLLDPSGYLLAAGGVRDVGDVLWDETIEHRLVMTTKKVREVFAFSLDLEQQ